MRRNTIIAAIGALLLGSLAAQAQEPIQQQVEPAQQVDPTQQVPEGFSKQIEIEKEYSAVVAQAERIEVEPRLLDTTIVRPAMRYSIVSVACKSNFTTEEISPVGFSTAGWSKPGRLYLNVGAGAPLQSEADIYWTPVQSRGRLVSVALNHEGVEAKQTNLDGQRLSALTLKNRLATHFATPLGAGGHTRLTADVDYQGVVANPYGGVGVVAERNLIDNNALRGDVKVDGAFSQTSPLSYTARLRGNYALGNFGAGESPEDGSMWRYCVDFALRGLNRVKRWLPSQMTLYYYGVRSTGVSPYYDTSVTFVPEWSLRVGKWLPVHIMAGYDYMVYPGAVQSWRGLIGSVDVALADHHGYADSMNENLLKALNTKVIVLPIWDLYHPHPKAMTRIVKQGVPEIFPAGITEQRRNEMNEKGLGANIRKDGHIVVRVYKGGKKYQIFVLNDRSLDYEVIYKSKVFKAK